MLKKFFCIALLAFVSVGIVLAQNNNKVKKYGLTIGGHHQSAPYGSLIDLKNGKTYKIAEAANSQGDIDLLYAYGTNTKANLLSPNSNALNLFGKNYKEQVNEAWTDKNRGMMVVIKSTKKNKKLFRSLKKNADIEKLYAETAKSVRELENYNLITHGPARRIKEIEEGDLIVFRSQSRKFYAAGLVVGLQNGTRGSIDIDFRITQ